MNKTKNNKYQPIFTSMNIHKYLLVSVISLLIFFSLAVSSKSDSLAFNAASGIRSLIDATPPAVPTGFTTINILSSQINSARSASSVNNNRNSAVTADSAAVSRPETVIRITPFSYSYPAATHDTAGSATPPAQTDTTPSYQTPDQVEDTPSAQDTTPSGQTEDISLDQDDTPSDQTDDTISDQDTFPDQTEDTFSDSSDEISSDQDDTTSNQDPIDDMISVSGHIEQVIDAARIFIAVNVSNFFDEKVSGLLTVAITGMDEDESAINELQSEEVTIGAETTKTYRFWFNTDEWENGDYGVLIKFPTQGNETDVENNAQNYKIRIFNNNIADDESAPLDDPDSPPEDPADPTPPDPTPKPTPDPTGDIIVHAVPMTNNIPESGPFEFNINIQNTFQMDQNVVAEAAIFEGQNNTPSSVTQKVWLIGSGDAFSVRFEYNSGMFKEGVQYRIIGKVLPLPGETDTSNNLDSFWITKPHYMDVEALGTTGVPEYSPQYAYAYIYNHDSARYIQATITLSDGSETQTITVVCSPQRRYGQLFIELDGAATITGNVILDGIYDGGVLIPASDANPSNNSFNGKIYTGNN